MPQNPTAPAETKAQAMLLAAGRGERMRPLTDTCPKPLLSVQGKPLIEWHLAALAQQGIGEVVVNTAWLENVILEKYPESIDLSFNKILHNKLFNIYQNNSINSQLNDKIRIKYSFEGRDFGGALETAGGIARALPHLDDVFWVLAADVYVPGFTFTTAAMERFRASGQLAHLWLVPNPTHNPAGDFGLSPEGLALNLPKMSPHPKYTFSTIGLYRRALFEPPFSDIPVGNPGGIRAALAPVLRRAMDEHRVSAELWTGPWTDVGTPERLQALNAVNQPGRVPTEPAGKIDQ